MKLSQELNNLFRPEGGNKEAGVDDFSSAPFLKDGEHDEKQ